MYIQPNTVIKLCSNVPIDNTYEHSIYFTNKEAQLAFFNARVKRVFSAQTFQRVDRQTCRLQVPIGDVYDCNYMMFQNTSFSGKWFYAFITKVEYINNEVTEITYEIDDFQTWFFDYQLQYCFIERQHSVTDNIGDNIVAEPVALGEYVFNKRPSLGEGYGKLNFPNINNVPDYSSLDVVIAIVDVRGASVDGKVYDGIYGSAELWAFRKNDVSNINAKIEEYIHAPDSILSIYMVPSASMLVNIPEYGGIKLPHGLDGASSRYEGVALTGYELIDGYRPNNKKLYTYPFNFFHVDNGNGKSLELRYEFFEDLKPYLVSKGTITQPVQVALWPAGYKNAGTRADGGLVPDAPLHTESLELQGYPMCSWNVDSYKAWVAQNSVPLALGTAAQMGQMGIAATFSTNPAMSLLTGSIGTAANLLSQAYSASIAADMSKGALNNGGVNCAAGYQTFYGGRASITGDMAKRIDQFFDYYGYQVNELGIPNLAARPHWTYLKLATCVFTGSVPNDAMSRIAEIYKQGITMWKDGNEVGNYSLDNRVR